MIFNSFVDKGSQQIERSDGGEMMVRRQRNQMINLRICGMMMMMMMMMRWEATAGEPEILINKGCNQYPVKDFSDFSSNLNVTFKKLGDQLNGGKKFVTVQQPTGSDPVYAMVQCRDYLSTADCVACLTAAETLIRNCSSANGARVVYLDCSLRYETTSSFFDEITQEGNFGFCGNRTALQTTAFQIAAQELLQNLIKATPKISGFYAAAGKNNIGSRNNDNNNYDDNANNSTTGSAAAAVYGIAQCVETITQEGCQTCLSGALGNLQKCLDQAFGWAFDVGCFLRYSDTPFFANNQTTDITPFLKNGSSTKKAIIGGAVGGGIGLILFAMLVLFIRPRKSKKFHRGNILDATELQGPLNYKHKDLVSATRNFSEENKLGAGGFGDVYKGTLKNGKIVAVKKLAIGISRRPLSEFENEVRLISNVHHRNLVRLLGCCSQGPELILVYEYMANSSLDKFLFGEKRGTLNWEQRFEIILGTARGLAYLHEDFHVCIIHRDIKPGNVLLDDNLQPKIADFGLARLLPENQSHVSTKFAGTLGYTAPEYAIRGQLSEKVDTYSFGVLVLEILGGKKNGDTKGGEEEYLLKRAWKLYVSGMHWALMDESLDPKEYTKEEAEKVIEIALLCTQSAATARPRMSEVVALLKSKSTLLEHKPQFQPPFVEDAGHRQVHHEDNNSTSTATGSSSASNATISITQYSGR